MTDDRERDTDRAAVRYEPWHSWGLLTCLDCGALVNDEAAHTRFHSILGSHGWALAVLQTAHLSPRTHDRYDVPQRIRSKHFDNWSADAFAEVVADLPQGDPS